MIIFKQFSFDSAHFLPNVPEQHKCRAMHGHTYHLTIFIEGEIDPQLGWLMDFTELKEKVKLVIDILDHKLLNNIEGLDNPTCEILAVWIWEKLKIQFPRLKKIELNETPTSGVIYKGR